MQFLLFRNSEIQICMQDPHLFCLIWVIHEYENIRSYNSGTLRYLLRNQRQCRIALARFHLKFALKTETIP